MGGIRGLVLNDDDPAVYNAGLPVVAFRFNDEFRKSFPHIKQASVSTLLRVKGYIIPSMLLYNTPVASRCTKGFCDTDYNLPPNVAEIEILRVVVRESMSVDLLDR